MSFYHEGGRSLDNVLLYPPHIVTYTYKHTGTDTHRYTYKYTLKHTGTGTHRHKSLIHIRL